MSRRTAGSDPLRRVVAVINGKGGVGKTSMTATVAAYLAGQGLQVLALDLDKQDNLRVHFGLDSTDRGNGMVRTLVGNADFPLVPAREGLDITVGGRALNNLTALDEFEHGGLGAEFAHHLAQVAGRYDLVLLDAPPNNEPLQQMLLAAARWVLVPTCTDLTSLHGLIDIGPLVTKAQQGTNPHLAYLGMVLTQVNPAATAQLRQVEETLTGIDAHVLPRFTASIRYSRGVANTCQSEGITVHELAARRPSDDAAARLAQDYTDLALEIVHRIQTAEKGTT